MKRMLAVRKDISTDGQQQGQNDLNLFERMTEFRSFLYLFHR
jgi:hypothetical protein